MARTFETVDRLSRAEVRALASAMHKMSNGADNFLAALRKARMEKGGQLMGENLWRQIAGEIAVLEASSPSFGQRLRIVAGTLALFAAAAMCFVRMRLP